MTAQEEALFRALIQKIQRLEKVVGIAETLESGVGATIDASTAKTTPVDADAMPLLDSAASNVLKKVTWANIKATLLAYFNGLYVALTGAQTVAGVKTLSDGLKLGAGTDTLAVYDVGTWSPVITASVPGGTPPVTTYTIQTGRFTQIGDLVFFTIFIRINTYAVGTGTGEVQISLPSTSSSTNAYTYVAGVSTNGVDWPGTPINAAFEVAAGQSYGRLVAVQDNATRLYVDPAALAAADDITAAGFYMV